LPALDAALWRCPCAPFTEVTYIKVKVWASLDAVQAVVSEAVMYANPRKSTPPVAATYCRVAESLR
jgi:hypothetical protein